MTEEQKRLLEDCKRVFADEFELQYRENDALGMYNVAVDILRRIDQVLDIEEDLGR